MKNILFALLVIGIVFSFVRLFQQEGRHEWKGYQKVFKSMELEAAHKRLEETTDEKSRLKLQESLALLERSGVEIKQVFLEHLDVADRCQSCHLGIADMRYTDAPQPFTQHTDPFLDSHPVYKFGCTICHQGQGRGTTTEGGHGYEENWKDPLVPIASIEASCIQCHSDLKSFDAPTLVQGQDLIERYGCLGCHEGRIFGEEEKTGYALDNIGAKVKPEWIARFLKDPKAYSAETRMPNFRLSDQEIGQLQDYLKALGEKALDMYQGEIADSLQDLEEARRRGQELAKELACTTCHTIEAIPKEDRLFAADNIGTELSRVGSKVKKEVLRRILKDPNEFQPDIGMPTYRLMDEDITALTAFLQSLQWEVEPGGLPENQGSSPPIQSAEGAEVPEVILTGRQLIQFRNCGGGHEGNGIIKGERGPSWDGMGSKSLIEFDFGEKPYSVEYSKLAWIKEKIMNPRGFRDTLKMPYFDLPEEDVEAIRTVLLGLTDREIPDAYKVADKDLDKPSIYVPKVGPVGSLLEDLKCLECHTIQGEGGNVGPILSDESNRAKRAWLEGFLKKPVEIRPMFAARMPYLKLSEEEISILADFIEMTLVNNDQREGIIDEENVSESSVTQGDELFNRKYGCAACHVIQLGVGGLTGPSMVGSQERLKGDWVYAYLKDPQTIIQDAMMPNYVLTHEELKAMTDYLMSITSVFDEE